MTDLESAALKSFNIQHNFHNKNSSHTSFVFTVSLLPSNTWDLQVEALSRPMSQCGCHYFIHSDMNVFALFHKHIIEWIIIIEQVIIKLKVKLKLIIALPKK